MSKKLKKPLFLQCFRTLRPANIALKSCTWGLCWGILGLLWPSSASCWVRWPSDHQICPSWADFHRFWSILASMLGPKRGGTKGGRTHLLEVLSALGAKMAPRAEKEASRTNFMRIFAPKSPPREPQDQFYQDFCTQLDRFEPQLGCFGSLNWRNSIQLVFSTILLK